MTSLNITWFIHVLRFTVGSGGTYIALIKLMIGMCCAQEVALSPKQVY